MVNYALKKEETRRHGDQLDAKLRKATIEVHALSNTLNVVKQRNHAMRVGRDAKPTGQLVVVAYSVSPAFSCIERKDPMKAERGEGRAQNGKE